MTRCIIPNGAILYPRQRILRILFRLMRAPTVVEASCFLQEQAQYSKCRLGMQTLRHSYARVLLNYWPRAGRHYAIHSPFAAKGGMLTSPVLLVKMVLWLGMSLSRYLPECFACCPGIETEG